MDVVGGRNDIGEGGGGCSRDTHPDPDAGWGRGRSGIGEGEGDRPHTPRPRRISMNAGQDFCCRLFLSPCVPQVPMLPSPCVPQVPMFPVPTVCVPALGSYDLCNYWFS